MMQARLTFAMADGDDPFANLALEEALFGCVEDGEVLLYLWQNANTIVIGRNQNPWKECRVERFEADGGRIARRLSGGGAVFHDSGNLNFTFIARDPLYDAGCNCGIICDAVSSFGVDARMTGRNDLTVEGAKFSGNAFTHRGRAHCHHGTLMIDVDTGRLARYLVPDPRKLSAKGVDSVRSRVANLSGFSGRITPETLSVALIEAAGHAFGAEPEPFDRARLDGAALAERTAFFASHAWRFGRTLPFTHRFDERFAWGGADINLVVEKGLVGDVRAYSDALDADFIGRVEDALRGCRYEARALDAALAAVVPPDDPAQLADVRALVRRALEDN